MPRKPYLSADEAATRLGISKSTLYSYVSRGLIRSEATPGPSRTRRYAAADVEALCKRKELRRNPARAAEAAMHFGAPVLESAITLIDNGALYYRGHDASTLATQRTFEEVAALLWTGRFDSAALFAENAPQADPDFAPVIAALRPQLAQHLPDARPFELFQILLPVAATQDLAAYNLAPDAVARTGARILGVMTGIVCGAPGATPIAQRLQQTWAAPNAAATRALDAALILCADHELNVSSFTARCVASAGSPPYAAVVAGLSALQGPKHGGSTEHVERLFADAERDPRRAVADRLKRGESIPGFGHRLYPDGDPRGRLLLDLAAELSSDVTDRARALAAEVETHTRLRPNLDFGLVTLARALALPPGAALTLFALGRTAGWIGHIIEQYEANQMIRPRARYVGVQPAG